MYLTTTINDVVCYRSATSYDAEILIRVENNNYDDKGNYDSKTPPILITQRVLATNLPTRAEAEKIASDKAIELQKHIAACLLVEVKNFKVAKE